MAPYLPTDCRELLDRQRGVLARWQAAPSGLDCSSIDNWVRRGRWQKLYFGVYADYTGEPARDSLLWAALCRSGPGAALSHFTAAELDGIRGRRTEAIHVAVPGRRRARIAESEYQTGLPRVVVHRSGRIGQARHPAKSPPRTRLEEYWVN